MTSKPKGVEQNLELSPRIKPRTTMWYASLTKQNQGKSELILSGNQILVIMKWTGLLEFMN